MKDIYERIGLDHHTYVTTINLEGVKIIAGPPVIASPQTIAGPQTPQRPNTTQHP